jgi:hypothetical protein
VYIKFGAVVSHQSHIVLQPHLQFNKNDVASGGSGFVTRCKEHKKIFKQKFAYRSDNEAKISLGKRNEAKKLKRNEAKKLVLCFRLSMRKQCETYPVSLRFASKRKIFLCKTGAPYPRPPAFSQIVHTIYRNS